MTFKFFSILCILLSISYSLTSEPQFNRQLEWAGYTWSVKSSRNKLPPGPNFFSQSTEVLILDEEGLHLNILQKGNRWLCSEIRLEENLGYGRYELKIRADLNSFPASAVFGFFTWSDNPDHYHREVDIELSRWGIFDTVTGQFTVQPHTNPDNKKRFIMETSGTALSLIFEWDIDEIRFAMYHGHAYHERSDELLLESWTYKQAFTDPDDAQLRVNFWLYEGNTEGLEQLYTVTLQDFIFTAPEKTH